MNKYPGQWHLYGYISGKAVVKGGVHCRYEVLKPSRSSRRLKFEGVGTLQGSALGRL